MDDVGAEGRVRPRTQPRRARRGAKLTGGEPGVGSEDVPDTRPGRERDLLQITLRTKHGRFPALLHRFAPKYRLCHQDLLRHRGKHQIARGLSLEFQT